MNRSNTIPRYPRYGDRIVYRLELEYGVIMYTDYFDAREGKTTLAATALATKEDAVAWIESRASQPRSCGPDHWVALLGGEEYHYVIASREVGTSTYLYGLPCPYPHIL